MKTRIEILTDLLKDDPKDAFTNYALGLELKAIDKAEEAIQKFEYLKSIHPEYLPLYYQLGKLYEQINKIEKALIIFKEGSSLASEIKDLKTKSELDEEIWMLED